MTRTTSRNAQKLKASYESLQSDLAAVVDDLEKMAANGTNVGLEKAKKQIDGVQEQIESLLNGAAETSQQSVEMARRSVAENPFTVMAAAFATGIAVASMLGRRH